MYSSGAGRWLSPIVDVDSPRVSRQQRMSGIFTHQRRPRALMQLRINFRQFDASFWRYLASFSVLSVGVFIFAELYPLFMLDRGASVVVIGNASLALNVGSIAGTIPAVVLMRLLGLKGAIVLSLVGVSLASAARLWHTSDPMVYGGAFAAGFFFAVLNVGIAVAVSGLTVPANRALGFSWFFGVTIVSGFLGDLVGSEVPGLIATLSGDNVPGDAKLVAALFACGISLASVIPAAGLRFSRSGRREKLSFPRDTATLRLLIAIGVWNFAVGLFTPFYTLYFSVKLGESVRAIGVDLASGQIVGAIFTMLAPACIARWGTVQSVRSMMVVAGVCSLWLAVSVSMVGAALGYVIYMGCVAMAQPPLNTRLMNQVSNEEQTGASMLSSLFSFSAVAAGGYTGGRLINALGFEGMLALAGACCLFASFVFIVMVKKSSIAGDGRVAV